MSDRNNLGNKQIMSKNLKRYIELSGKERREIADALKISYSTLTDWVNGKSYPRIDKIEMMAKYFNITKPDLIEEPDLLKGLGKILLDPDENDKELLRIIKDIKDMNNEQRQKLKKFIELIKSNLL